MTVCLNPNNHEEAVITPENESARGKGKVRLLARQDAVNTSM